MKDCLCFTLGLLDKASPFQVVIIHCDIVLYSSKYGGCELHSCSADTLFVCLEEFYILCTFLKT